MEAKKIIIVSCGRTTDVMIDGNLYKGVTAADFSQNGGEINNLRLTGDPIPTVDDDPESRAGFMQKIAEFSKVPESHSQKGKEESKKQIENTLQSIDCTLKRIVKIFLGLEEQKNFSVQISERNSNDLIKEHA